MKRPPTLDPQRLHIAHHELGHWIAWNAYPTVGTKDIQVWGYGRNAEGHVTPGTDGRLRNQQQCRDFLIGLLAGREADAYYCTRAGIRFNPTHSKADLRAFRRIHKHEWVRDVAATEFRTLAREIVHANWSHIVRLAPTLARRGHL